MINNFKSIDKLTLDFTDFTCLIGLNSSGKSTILQSLDFISQQMNGDITQWLNTRGWESEELSCKLTQNKDIIIAITFTYNDKFAAWTFVFNPILKKCTIEDLRIYENNYENEKIIFKVEDSKYMIIKDLETDDILKGDILYDYEGSLLSNLKPEFLPNIIIEFKEYIKNIYSLDLLSPRELRKPSDIGSKLGLSGENLSAFLNTFTKKQKNNLLNQLKKCYNNIDSINIVKTKDDKSKIELVEKFNGTKLVNEAKYLNDGILRLIAVLAQLQSEKSFLLFDELENGINSELIEFLLDSLIASEHQVMITTHSPMILNYIDDEVAMKSVQYIYKTEEGFTKSIPFFDIPSMKEKLEFMGVGEVYVDTNLSNLYEEIKLIEEQKDKD